MRLNHNSCCVINDTLCVRYAFIPSKFCKAELEAAVRLWLHVKFY